MTSTIITLTAAFAAITGAAVYFALLATKRKDQLWEKQRTIDKLREEQEFTTQQVYHLNRLLDKAATENRKNDSDG